MYKKVIIALIFIVSVKASHGQGIAGMSFHGFVPTGELREDASEIWGAGFGIEGAYKLPAAPLLVGGVLDFTRYGSTLRKGFHGNFWGNVRYRRNFEMVRFLPFVRLQPLQAGSVLPYADFYAGISYIGTRSTIRERDLDVLDTFTDLEDVVFSYGFGGGIEIVLGEDVSLDLNVKVIKTSRAQYLTPEAVTYDRVDNFYQFDVQNSRFNNITFGVGFKVLLTRDED